MKIGVSSQNFRTITGHAGKSRRFIVFDSQEDGSVQQADRLDLPKEMSLHEFHGEQHPLFDLDVLITGGCGQGFRQRLLAQGVLVIVTGETDPIRAAEACVQGRELPPARHHQHQGHDSVQPPAVKRQIRSGS